MVERLLSYAETRRACGGLSESSIRRLVAEGRFPRPVVLSRTKSGRAARVAFVSSEVEAVVADIIEKARGKGEAA